MFKQFIQAASRLMAKANSNDALIPEIWSREALMTLMSNTVFAALVHRDFSAQVASEGDVVNTSRPADFTGKRKTDSDNVTDQDAVSPNIPVPLNQHFHVSYVIKDGELSKALPDLLERYMEPAAREIAESVDRVLAGQVARLQTYQVGQPGAVTSLNVDDYILDADEKLNDNRAPKAGRRLVMSSRFNRAALGAEIVVESDKRGDQGTALREASVGRIYGFDSFMDQNVSHVKEATTDVAVGATDAAQVETDITIPTTITFAATETVAGVYVVIDGSQYAHRALTVTDATSDCDIVLQEGITADVPISTVATIINAALVDDVAGDYIVGWAKEIVIDDHTASKNLQVGQLVSFTVTGETYTVISAENTSTTSTTVLLDRPLEAALTNNVACYPGPWGSRSVAFTRDALALVSRPLSTAANGNGARSAVASFDGLSMRVTTQYDSKAQGTRITFDLLCGVAILNEKLACVING